MARKLLDTADSEKLNVTIWNHNVPKCYYGVSRGFINRLNLWVTNQNKKPNRDCDIIITDNATGQVIV